MDFEQHIVEIDGEKIVCETNVLRDNVVILHGAGASSRKRFRPLAKAILRRDIGVVLFDFSSHGDSTGRREELSLERRTQQAQKIIETFIPPEGKLYLVGFSMSGQTACDLLPIFRQRVPAILLGCPAAYSRDAQHLVFDGGEFTRKIRLADSWKDSSAFNELRAYEGKTVVAIGKEDTVIPSEVIQALRQSAKRLDYVEYAGVDHQLAVWLASHEQEQDRLLDLLFS